MIEMNKKYHFNATTNLRMMAQAQFYVDELILHVRDVQIKRMKSLLADVDIKANKSGAHRLLQDDGPSRDEIYGNYHRRYLMASVNNGTNSTLDANMTQSNKTSVSN